MAVDDEIKIVLLEILEIGILRIRSFGVQGMSEACVKEADHLHNLPQLIQSFDWELLRYYMDVEKPILAKCHNVDAFGQASETLDKIVAQRNSEGNNAVLPRVE